MLHLAALIYLAIVRVTTAQQPGCGASFSDSQVASLIASSYRTPQGTLLPNIVLQNAPGGFRFRTVCLSSSGFRDEYRFVSIVAYYTMDGGAPQYGQYEFECVQSQWTSSSTLLDLNEFNRLILVPTDPAINASLRTDCSYCLSSAFLTSRRTDPINHCKACIGCSEPQLCYSDDNNPPNAQCCNVSTCATQCPSSPPSFPDAQRNCVSCFLSCKNGDVLQSATCTCDCSKSVLYGGQDCTSHLNHHCGSCNDDTGCKHHCGTHKNVTRCKHRCGTKQDTDYKQSCGTTGGTDCKHHRETKHNQQSKHHCKTKGATGCKHHCGTEIYGTDG